MSSVPPPRSPRFPLNFFIDPNFPCIIRVTGEGGVGDNTGVVRESEIDVAE